MRLEYEDGLYVVFCTYDERLFVKNAGFTWNPSIKKWTTRSDSVACNLLEWAVGDALKRLESFSSDVSLSLEKSMATHLDADFPKPEGLDYLPYQRAGISYILDRQDTLIADPPGLGKTIQFIGAVNATSIIDRVLIICPASLKLNWIREFKKWDVRNMTVGSPETVNVRITDGDGVSRHVREYQWPDTQVVVVNYDILPKYVDAIRSVTWSLLCCDESHLIKNPKATRTIHVLGGGKGKNKVDPIPAKQRVFMTGTPILNKPADLWTVIRAFDRGGLGRDYMSFVFKYCGAYKTGFGIVKDGQTNSKELQTLLRSRFMIRRDKREVLPELPTKRRQIVLLPGEGLSRVVKKENKSFIDNLEALAKLSGEEVSSGDDLTDEQMQKMVDLAVGNLMDYEDLKSNPDVFNEQFKHHFEALSQAREELGIAKVRLVKEYVDRLLESEDKVVIFAVHKGVVTALAEHYKDISCVVTGSVPVDKRQGQVDSFQNDPKKKVFIGNIDAAGVGYTLVAASHLVFAELDWVVAKVEQAEDRINRIGQKRGSHYHYLVVEGTVEARLLEVVVKKKEMTYNALDSEIKA